MNTRRTLTWLAVAAFGVGLTTAVTITTTLLSQQPIALASEPLSAGNTLVPTTVVTASPAPAHLAGKHRRTAKRRQPAAKRRRHAVTTLTRSVPSASVTPSVVVKPTAVASAAPKTAGSPAQLPNRPVARTSTSGEQSGRDSGNRKDEADQRTADD